MCVFLHIQSIYYDVVRKYQEGHMKKALKTLLAAVMTLSLTGCGTSTGEGTPAPAPDAAETPAAAETSQEAPVSEEDQIVDEAWDQLQSLGKIETENGLFITTLTLPADIVGTDITQETIDANAGENYISGKLNEDGSVTYKMTKAQHKAMLDQMIQTMDDGLQEMKDSDEYSFAEITHNKDFTSFDVTLDTNEIGLQDSFMTLAFYMYGGFYGIFSGRTPDNVEVNFLAPDGTLIETYNSKDAGTTAN